MPVALADARRVSGKVDFQFTTHLLYSDENGVLVGQENGGGKLSENKARGCPVPERAVDAVLSVDCFCAGVHELEVPFFASRPYHR